MNYLKHYNALIDRAKIRCVIGYKENHHIIPRCMGGGDEPSNLVELTPEEHYVAHQLLTKIYPNNKKLLFAAKMMCVSDGVGCIRNNKLFGWIKRKCNDALKGSVSWHAGKKNVYSQSTLEKMRSAKLGKKRGAMSSETKKKISMKNAGKAGTRNGVSLSIETKEKMRLSSKSTKILCIELNTTFDSIRQAAIFVNGSDWNIANCARGKHKSAYGYTWKFV